MLTTTHYGLNIVEGTDVVNPLVQQNPNYTAIDSAMYANKQAVIGTGTELTAGTVHTITRLNQDSNYVRFTATSNWTAGDTMVVDSTPVSVYLSDGTAPATGAYVINTEVLILVNGSRVTLLTSANDDQTAADVTYRGVSVADWLDTSVRGANGASNYGTLNLETASVGSLVVLTGNIIIAEDVPANTQFITNIPALHVGNYVPFIAWDNSALSTVTWLLASNGTIQNVDALVAGHSYRFTVAYLF